MCVAIDSSVDGEHATSTELEPVTMPRRNLWEGQSGGTLAAGGTPGERRCEETLVRNALLFLRNDSCYLPCPL
jgi:hypothetical protein